MATETLSSLGPTYPRATSLYTPERPANPILDHSSYSPFPTIPGSNHARDPYGLNAFLLHPTDALWDYMQPAPAGTCPSDQSPLVRARSPSAGAVNAVLMEGLDGENEVKLKRTPSLRKQMSLGQLRPSSPTEPVETVERDQSVTVTRRRTKSVGSPSMLRKELELDEDAIITKALDSDFRPRNKSLATRSLRSALHKARKSLLGPTARHVEEVDLPVVTYSPSSGSSDLPTTSSSSSSDGVRTPASTSSEHIPDPVAPVKLADALEEGVGRKNWLGWLGGKRGGNRSKDSTPSSSRGSSPNASSLSLTKTPSPPATREPVSRVSPPPNRPKTYSWVGESLRRSSLRKAAALRRPSPHPLARQLARQGHLPQEVAIALRAESGQRTYPNSVNSPSYLSTPGNGALRITLGIRAVVNALNDGRLPPGTYVSPSLKQNTKGKGGMRDFIDRRPFEDRMLVFYPGGKFSPVSMARPGFGIWDLEFSAHVLFLAALSGETTPVRTPRGSYHSEVESGQAGESPDGEAEVEILVTPPPVEEGLAPAVMADVSPSPSSPSLPTLGDDITEAVSPMPKSSTGADSSGVTIDEEDDGILSSFRPLPRSAPPKSRPLSSFQNSRKSKSATEWDTDSDESDEESPEEAEDAQPLAMVSKRNSSMPSLSASRSRPVSMLPLLAASQPFLHSRMNGQPNAERSSKRISLDPIAAMKEVALARQRQEASRSGEVERRAEAANQREKDAKRQSANMPSKRASMSTSNLAKSSTSSAARARDEVRRRTKSTYEIPQARPGHVRTSTAPTSALGQRRVHSSYDLLSRAPQAGPQPYYLPHSHSAHMIYPHPNQAAFFHPAPIVYSGPMIPQSHSMTFQYPSPAFAPAHTYSRGTSGIQKPLKH